MAKDNWFSRLNPFTKSQPAEFADVTKELRAQVDSLSESLDYETKFLETEPSGFNTKYSADFTGIDQQLDSAALLRLMSTETWVYSAVMAIAKDIAKLDLKGQKAQFVNQQITNEATGLSYPVRTKVWTDSEDNVFNILETPNPYTTSSEFLTLLAIDLLTCGEYFIYLDSDSDLTSIANNQDTEANNSDPFSRLATAMANNGGKIKGMYRLPPPLIKPVPSEDRTCVEMYAMQSDKGVFAFSFAEIIHVKLPNPNSPFQGLSPLVAAFKPVLLDRFSTEHMVRFYKTGARLGGVINTEKPMNKEQFARFQRSFEGNFTGRRNHHRTLILLPGMKYQQIEANPAETALLEFCKYNREAILSVYHVPPIKVGIMDGANYANAIVQQKSYFTETVMPIIKFMEDGFNKKSCLWPNNMFRAVFDLSKVEVLQEDYRGKAEMAGLMYKGGLTVNEIRKMVWTKGPIAGGDKSYNVAEIKRLDSEKGGGLMNLEAPHSDSEKDLTVEDQPGLIHTDVAGQKPCDKCKKDPCECPKPKKTLNEFIADAITQLDEKEAITPEFIAQLTALFNSEQKESESVEHKDEIAEVAPIVATPENVSSEQAIQSPKVYPHGISHERVAGYMKTFAYRTDPLVEKRAAEIQKFFKYLRMKILNRVGGQIKAFGMHKAVDNDDINAILNFGSMQELINEYIKEIDQTLKKAYEEGYNDTLVNFTFDLPNQDAVQWLKAYAAKEVKQISDTTRDQLHDVLSKSFEEGVSVNEVATRISEKFDQIDAGRALTIARTETLSAVSQGQQKKQEEWQKKFPDKKLSKMWVSSHKENYREEHAEMDGETVDADETFSNGLLFPRDWDNGGPEDNINCGCSRLTVASEDAEAALDNLDLADESRQNSDSE